MAATIKKEVGVDPELIEGEKGIFEIRVDGDVVFARKPGDDFPDEMLVVDLIKGHGE